MAFPYPYPYPTFVLFYSFYCYCFFPLLYAAAGCAYIRLGSRSWVRYSVFFFFADLIRFRITAVERMSLRSSDTV